MIQRGKERSNLEWRGFLLLLIFQTFVHLPPKVAGNHITLAGNAVTLSNGNIMLTNETTSQAGAAWLTSQVNAASISSFMFEFS